MNIVPRVGNVMQCKRATRPLEDDVKRTVIALTVAAAAVLAPSAHSEVFQVHVMLDGL